MLDLESRQLENKWAGLLTSLPSASITSPHRRADEVLLDWSQQKLADLAGVGIVTIRQLEGENQQPRRATLAVVRTALEAAGVEFIDENGGGAGVRLRKPHKSE